MDILYLLIPLSSVLVLFIIGIFGWAVHSEQFENLDSEGQRILEIAGSELDRDQGAN